MNLFQKKKKQRPSSVVEETAAETVQWSNADIEFPSTSTSDEIEIISQTDDETICKLLSALPVAGDTDQIQDDNTTLEEDATIAAQSSAEITAASESGRVLT